MYLNFLGTVGLVKDPEVCVRAIKTMSGEENIDLDYINSYYESLVDGVIYLNDKANKITTPDAEKRARYKLVPTGYKKKFTGAVLYASFIRGKMGWNGAYIEDFDTLQERMKNYYNEKLKEPDEVEVVLETEVAKRLDENKKKEGIAALRAEIDDKILSRLEDREKFEIPKDSKCDRLNGKSRLYAYLSVFASRALWQISKGIDGEYIVNGDKTLMCINTGLLDKYMRVIFVLANINTKDRSFEIIDVIDSKSDLVKAGFDKEKVKKMPDVVQLYDNKEQLIFMDDIDSFDIDRYSRLKHILVDRKDRFPKEISEWSEDVIIAKIKESVGFAVKMQKRNYRYILPIYNCTDDEMSYLIPLHFNTSMCDEPELVAIAAHGKDGFYEIVTVISVEDAYDCARPLARLDNCWIK